MNYSSIIYWADKEKLASEIISFKPDIIVIDGEDGSGKSNYLAPFLRDRLNGKVVSIDDFLSKNQGGYIEHINYVGLKNAIKSNHIKPLIIEGVQSLDVLKRIGIESNYLVYSCKEQWLREWTEYYEKNEPIESIIQNVEKQVSIISPGYRMKGLRYEMYCYTYNFRPFNVACKIIVMPDRS